MGCSRGRGFGCSGLGYGISHLQRGPINPTIELPELTQDWGSTFGGHKQNLVHTRTQEKGAVTPQETDPDLPVSVLGSPAEVWVGGGPAAGSGALSGAVCAWDLVKEVAVVFTTSTKVWSPVNNREGTQPRPSAENWI